MAASRSPQTLVSILSSSWLFESLEGTRLEKIAAHADMVNRPRGAMIYMQDDDADYIYVIAQGWVKLYRKAENGSEAVYDVLTAGHVFGEDSLFNNKIYSCGATTADECQFVRIPYQVLETLIKTDTQAAFVMMKGMADHARRKNQEIEHRTLQSTAQRLGCYILHLCHSDKNGAASVQLPYDKMLVASRLGMQPETFSRALSRLRSDAGINVKGSLIEIGDVTRLKDYTCEACTKGVSCEDEKG